MFVDVSSSFTVPMKDIEMCSPAGGQGFKAPFNQGPILFEVLQKQIYVSQCLGCIILQIKNSSSPDSSELWSSEDHLSLSGAATKNGQHKKSV